MGISVVGSALFTRDDSAKAVFIAWEGLRIAYNTVLIVLTFALALAFEVAIDASFWQRVLPGALFANVCFCVGSSAEGYLALMGADRRLARGFIFLSGLSLTSLMALVVVFTPEGLGWD
ncbi:MAG: hypothetical protein M3552_20430 [Planctomycetota bacterium]|nr:hypothetical protein [Planctomycetaceae bacterium]MDQ3332984.1 hypothetical protein [Planctomycetota bacterium]